MHWAAIVGQAKLCEMEGKQAHDARNAIVLLHAARCTIPESRSGYRSGHGAPGRDDDRGDWILARSLPERHKIPKMRRGKVLVEVVLTLEPFIEHEPSGILNIPV